MLTCITCSRQRSEDDDEDAPRGTKDAVKSLTSQIKDIALKVSGSHKGKTGLEEEEDSRFKRGRNFDGISEGAPWQAGSSSSTPRYTGFGNERPPRVPESISSSHSNNDVLLEDEAGPKEWMAQVEPGVQITFVSLPRGGNDLKRIRFSREMFNKWEAQRWWGENYDRIMELYNVHRFNQQALNTPGRSEDGRDSTYSRMESPRMTPSLNKEWTPRYNRELPLPPPHQGSSSAGQKGEEPSRTTTSSRDEASASASVSISNASEVEMEWIEEDEPGVYITIRQLMDGSRELRRVRFSRERFGEVHAKVWWETNRDRIQTQYLC